VTTYPADVLARKCDPFAEDRFDDALRGFVERMVTVRRRCGSVGLVAPQLSVPLRVIVWRGENGKDLAAVNPRIVEAEGSQLVDEECLSLPGPVVQVERPERVVVVGQDLRGNEITAEGVGLEAAILSHEVDHLDGILIIDRVDRQRRRNAIRHLPRWAAA
jgi:peptide deformylase